MVILVELPSFRSVSSTSDGCDDDDYCRYVLAVYFVPNCQHLSIHYTVILVLRTYALYMQDRRVLAFLVTLYVVLASGAIVRCPLDNLVLSLIYLWETAILKAPSIIEFRYGCRIEHPRLA